jgi:2-dehydro-3-deoxyglucarate aldolase
MNGKRIKEKIARKELVFGTFFQHMTNPAIADVLPDDGLDFVVLNDEHNALDMGDFHGMQYALNDKGIACLVRIYNRDPELVAKACDAYPDGVVIPYAEDINELKHLVAAAKYRPLKGEKLEHLINEGVWPSDKSKKWIEEKCENTLFCAMIESVTALERLDEICSIPGIDAVFVGPNDLTISMGIPEERDNPEFIDAMQKIIDTADKYGIPAGAHFSQLSHAQRLIKQGGRFIPFSSDLRMIQAGVPNFLATLKGEVTSSKEVII